MFSHRPISGLAEFIPISGAHTHPPSSSSCGHIVVCRIKELGRPLREEVPRPYRWEYGLAKVGAGGDANRRMAMSKDQ